MKIHRYGARNVGMVRSLLLGNRDNDDDRVPTEEEFPNKTILGDSFFALLDTPRLLNVLQDEVHVTVEGLDPAEEFAVVAAVDQDLGVALGGGREHAEGSTEELGVGLFARRGLVIDHSGHGCVVCVSVGGGANAKLGGSAGNASVSGLERKRIYTWPPEEERGVFGCQHWRASGTARRDHIGHWGRREEGPERD